jgi:hypothetical protein
MAEAKASCLCGGVAWRVRDPLDFTSHCHCGRCRKSHGTPFATYLICGAETFTLDRGRELIARYESSPGFFRPFCSRCGAVVPDGEPWKGMVGVPFGPFDDDPGVRPLSHIFVSSKPPWFEIEDDLPRFDGYPPGFDAAGLDDLPARTRPAGGVSGSCLCGDIAFTLEGAAMRYYNCHCSRCRKGRAALYASNAFWSADALRFTRGEERLAFYKVPEAQFFAQVFCQRCGSPMPRVDRDRGIVVVPAGSLDGDPGKRPERHTFVASKAPWFDIPGNLPQHDERPTA